MSLNQDSLSSPNKQDTMNTTTTTAPSISHRWLNKKHWQSVNGDVRYRVAAEAKKMFSISSASANKDNHNSSSSTTASINDDSFNNSSMSSIPDLPMNSPTTRESYDRRVSVRDSLSKMLDDADHDGCGADDKFLW